MAVTTATAIALASVAVAAAGTGVSVNASLEQAAAAEKAGKFNQQVAENNAIQAQQEAQFEANQIRKRNLVLLGKQRAAVGKSGVEASGSVTDVLLSTATEGELDRLAALYGGASRATYYKTQGKLAGMESRNAATAARYQAVGSLLTGAGNTAAAASRVPSSNNNPTFNNRARVYQGIKMPED